MLSAGPAIPSDLVVRAELVETAGTGPGDLLSPVVMDGRLYVADQTGRIVQQREDGWAPAWGPASVPAGVGLSESKAILGMAAGAEGRAVVVLSAVSWPDGTEFALTVPEQNRTSPPRGMLVYDYALTPEGELTDPRLVAAVEARTGGHRGGAVLVEDSGHILMTIGDHLPFDRDGGDAVQDVTRSSGKLLRIDPATGAVDVVARGLRNSQRMIWADDSKSRVVWSDIGSVTAEELNSLSLAALHDLAVVENFGWGKDEDGLVREGLFFVARQDQRVVTATGLAPTPDPGFEQPFASWGRTGEGFFAITGPVASAQSFDQIDFLVSDLVNGTLAAVVGAQFDAVDNPLLQVALVDAEGQPTDLRTLAGGRPDPRFFNFADGTAGVVLERTGALYRLTEVAPVPLPAGAWLLMAAAGLLGARRVRA